MAILSMTGFGVGKAHKSSVEIEVTVRTVNSRFLEVKTHLPREYLLFEMEIKNFARKLFRRGTVDIFVHRRMMENAKSRKLIFHQNVLNDYLKTLEAIKKRLRIRSEISIQDLLAAEGVFSVEEHGAEVQVEKSVLLKAVKDAVHKASEARKLEGKSLSVELERLLTQLRATAAVIEEKIPTVRSHLTERIQNRMQELKTTVIDPARVAQEIALQLEKSDIQEEIVRFQTHLNYCFDLLKQKDSPGKNLDFYSQELLREINTIGSKVASAEVANLVVQVKTAIDQFKEQVSNIE